MTLADSDGKGVRIETEGDVAFSLSPWNDTQLLRSLHHWELPASDSLVAHFDAGQRGLGNASCGPGPLDAYKLTSGQHYSNTVRFSPYGFGTATDINVADEADDGIVVSTTGKTISVRGSLQAGTQVAVYSSDGTLLTSRTLTRHQSSLTIDVATGSRVCILSLKMDSKTIIRKLIL